MQVELFLSVLLKFKLQQPKQKALPVTTGLTQLVLHITSSWKESLDSFLKVASLLDQHLGDGKVDLHMGCSFVLAI
jgi:hypothetical protein